MACASRCCIISSVLVAILLSAFIGSIIYIAIEYTGTTPPDEPSDPDPNKETPKVPFITFSEGLIFTTQTNEIKAWDIQSNKVFPLVANETETIIAFDYYDNETVFYSVSGSRNPIVSASADYKSLQYFGEGWYVTALAVDSLGGNVYVYDAKGGKIDVFNVKNQKHAIVMTDIKRIKDIALDPYRGLMFLLDSKTVSMANMDGTNLEAIVEGDDISAFALDVANTTVYWSTSTHISQYNYIYKTESVVKSLKDCTVTNIGILPDDILTTCEKKNNGRTLTTTLSYLFGNDKVLDDLDLNDVQKFKVYGPAYLPKANTTCSKDNGGCDHFCLPGETKHTCACAVGWTLDANDGSSCKRADEYLVYLKDNFVRGQILNQTTFVEAIVPRPMWLMVLEEKDIIEVDYDARRNYLIYSDDHGLYRLDLTDNGTSQIQLGYNNESIILSPVVDWIGNQIYYLRYNASNEFNSLMVQKADQFSDSQNQRELYRFDAGIRPNALALAQYRGLVFFTVYNDSSQTTELCQLTTTGVDLTVLKFAGDYSMSEVALAIDYENDRFYWFDKDRKQVNTNQANGNIVSFDISMIKNPKKISVHGSLLYISSSQTTHYINKLDGTYGGQLLSSATTSDSWLSAAKVFSEQQQPIRPDHPCVEKNGGCDRYCFALQNDEGKLTGECACNDNEKLKDDDKGCLYKPSFPINGIPVNPNEFDR